MFFMVIPLKNSKLKTFYPWRIPKFQVQNPLPLKNSKLKTFYPWRIPKFQAQNPLPLKNSKLKTLYPWRIPSSKPFSPEEFQAQNPSPLKNSKLKTLYPWIIPSSKPFNPVAQWKLFIYLYYSNPPLPPHLTGFGTWEESYCSAKFQAVGSFMHVFNVYKKVFQSLTYSWLCCLCEM
jgi:hypothetical protein